jgi:hypothetical protein
MAFAFNPFTGNFDLKGSGGGGGASYIDGEVATYTDLPLDGSAALNTAWLVREASGTWLIARKPAGIYIRTATAGVSRDADYTYAGILPDVFNDANFLLYDNADSSKNLAFQLSGISASTTRTLTVPNSSGTIALTSQLTDVKIYTSNDTWTKPAGAKLIHYFIVAGGGGGGSGRRDTTANNGGGGAGGCGGSVNVGWADAASFDSTETVTIGAGGAGAVGSVANSTSGTGGTAGGASGFGPITSTGGPAGAAGSGSAGGAGQSASSALGYYYASSMGRGPSGSGGFSANATKPANALFTAAGGGGGGGKQGTTYYLGGDAGGVGASPVLFTAGGTAVTNAAGTNGSTWGVGFLGTGGGGGSPGTSGEANNGGNGGLYGGGGGGGSASTNDAGGVGKGGDGANGIVIITTYF